MCTYCILGGAGQGFLTTQPIIPITVLRDTIRKTLLVQLCTQVIAVYLSIYLQVVI